MNNVVTSVKVLVGDSSMTRINGQQHLDAMDLAGHVLGFEDYGDDHYVAAPEGLSGER